jgi:hypothetical protein
MADCPHRVDHRCTSARAAIVLVHGFGGNAEATWGLFPELLKRASPAELGCLQPRLLDESRVRPCRRLERRSRDHHPRRPDSNGDRCGTARSIRIARDSGSQHGRPARPAGAAFERGAAGACVASAAVRDAERRAGEGVTISILEATGARRVRAGPGVRAYAATIRVDVSAGLPCRRSDGRRSARLRVARYVRPLAHCRSRLTCVNQRSAGVRSR